MRDPITDRPESSDGERLSAVEIVLSIAVILLIAALAIMVVAAM